jgi:hypothetical protein
LVNSFFWYQGEAKGGRSTARRKAPLGISPCNPHRLQYSISLPAGQPNPTNSHFYFVVNISSRLSDMLAKVTCCPSSSLDLRQSCTATATSQNSSTYLHRAAAWHACRLAASARKARHCQGWHASKRQSGDLQLDIDPLPLPLALREALSTVCAADPPPVPTKKEDSTSSESWAVKGRK